MNRVSDCFANRSIRPAKVPANIVSTAIISNAIIHNAIFAAAIAVATFTAVFGAARPVAAQEPSEQSLLERGRAIYVDQCAGCHGAEGQGHAENYPHQLVGDKSINELAKLIHDTMPKDAAELCVDEDARAAAAYIHETFYSPTAQARRKPARVDLSRLTVRQYQQSLADILGAFRPQTAFPTTAGLRAEYYKKRQTSRDNRVLERVDPAILFQYRDSSPDPATIEPPEFAMRWNGSVIAPETGEYEFVLKTENGARLFVNNTQTALIDAWVRSGNGVEFRQSIKLLGGRAYPLRLDYFKFKEKTASIGLWWRKPRRTVDEPLTDRELRTATVPETFVVTTAFPPDDRSVGYERGAAISKAWDQAATDAALETAAYVAARLPELANAKPEDSERVKRFCRRFAELAFRRPLTDEQAATLVDQQFAAAGDVETAVKRVVLRTLKSPRFLLIEVPDGPPDAHDIAARLSWILWDSIPDAPLLAAASQGQLADPAIVLRQAQRMAADPRAQAKLADFFRQWLRIDESPDIAKDSTLFPAFSPALAADLRTSLELLVQQTITSDAADFRALLSAETVPLSPRLVAFYQANGDGAPADSGMPPTSHDGLAEALASASFRDVPLDPGQRAGLLTHPYLLSAFAYTATSSPIHRGVFLSRSLLGRSLKQPPEAVAPLSPDLHPQLTTRERVALQTNAESCRSCHNLINPLGFTLEAFDAAGRLRREEKGRPIDDSGTYFTREGEEIRFRGARELARFLTTTTETRDAFVEQLYHYLVKQPYRAAAEPEQRRLRELFATENHNMRGLAAAIAVSYACSPASTPSEPPPQIPALPKQ
jgi:mono/diheme cytochrome c family protein